MSAQGHFSPDIFFSENVWGIMTNKLTAVLNGVTISQEELWQQVSARSLPASRRLHGGAAGGGGAQRRQLDPLLKTSTSPSSETQLPTEQSACSK